MIFAREDAKSSPGLAYILSNWKALIRYCEDGDLEIDNNGAEPTLPSMAVGRKNWMFLGSDNGGRTAAVLDTLIATAKRLAIGTFAYFRHTGRWWEVAQLLPLKQCLATLSKQA
jgi:hypothetical protein